MWFFSLSVVTDRLTGSTVFFTHTHSVKTGRPTFFFFFSATVRVSRLFPDTIQKAAVGGAGRDTKL